MARLIDRKVQASSLIEVLIAMVIILIVFAIAMRIFGNIMQTGVSFRSITINSHLDVFEKEISTKGYLENEVIEVDSITYHFEMSEVGSSGIKQLKITAMQRGLVLESRKSLVNFKTPLND